LSKRASVQGTTAALVLIVAIVTAGTGGAGARRMTVASQAGDPEPPRIAYMSDRTGRWLPYADDLKAGALTPLLKQLPGSAALTPTDQADANLYNGLAWSPDGAKIAIGGNDALRIIELVGGRTITLPYGYDPTWSADGSKLAYQDNEYIYVVSAAGRDRKRLVDGLDVAAISPNGLEVAYDGENGVWVVPTDGGPPRLVAGNETGGVTGVKWSPDGAAIAYSVCCLEGTGLYIVGRTGSNPHRLPDAGPSSSGELTFAWSPDSEQLVATCGVELCRLSRDGSDPARLTHSAVGEPSFAPAWSPDGKRIAYLRGRGGPAGNDVYVTNVDGSGTHALTSAFPDGGTNVALAWPTTPIALKQYNSPLRLIEVRPSRSTSSESLITLLAARASGAAYVEQDAKSDACSVRVWAPHLQGRWGNECQGPNGQHPGRPLPTPFGAAWVRQKSARYTYFDDLVRGSVGRRPVVLAHPRDEIAGERLLGPLVDTGAGVECSAQTLPGSKMSLWRIVGDRAIAVAAGLAPGVVVSASGHLLAARARDGDVEVLTDAGRLLTRFKGRGVTSVAISEAGVVGITPANVLERWTFLGRHLRRYRLAHRATSPARLEDAHGSYVAYVEGAALHLFRLTDGRDRVVDEPAAAEPVQADLEKAGLYISYNVTYSSRPGRVAFIPTTQLKRLLQVAHSALPVGRGDH
jgi:Tol biopolymer transport system component